MRIVSCAGEKNSPSDLISRADSDLGLWTSFTRAVRDNLLGEIGVQGLRLGGLIILAHILEPSDFGVFRVLVAIAALATLTNTAGVPDALVQRLAG